jgi:transposase-like protein
MNGKLNNIEVVNPQIKCSRCGEKQFTKSGKNNWRVVLNKDGEHESVQLQRWFCLNCHKYNFSKLDGTPFKNDNNNGGS